MAENLKSKAHTAAGWQFWLLAAFLCLIFLTGGSSRADVQSLAILRPASICIFGIALLTLKRDDVVRYKTLLIFAGLITALVSIYLLPLPRFILAGFPANDIVLLIEKTAALRLSAPPAAAVPAQAWNSLYSLFTPLAVLMLAVQLNRHDLFRLLPLLLLLGLASGLLGFLQIMGNPQGPLYFYKITNNGAAVGFFTNRNHQALFLTMLFPMLAIFASSGIKSAEQATFRSWIAIAIGVFLVPLILVTGSRAGLVFGVMALMASLAIYRKPVGLVPAKRKTQRIDWRIPAVSLGILALGLTSLLLSRAEAIDRLVTSDTAEDARTKFWVPIAKMAVQNSPFGNGPGSFAESYAKIEPISLLNNSYLNRAHNDWLETFSNFGLLGAILLIAAIVAIILRGRSIIGQTTSASRELSYAKLGLLMIVLAALGSIVDYPLRTPTLSAVFVIALIWFNFAPKKTDKIGSN